jgi:transposase, IS5 family
MQCIVGYNNITKILKHPTMYYIHNYQQTSLSNFKTLGFELEGNELYKISKEVNWQEMLDCVRKVYKKTGANTNSLRVMVGLEMGKTYYGVSDVRIVQMLKTEVGLMVLCGYDRPVREEEVPSSNSMTDFRNRLTREILDQISTVVITQQIIKLPPKKRTQVGSDSTCMVANIQYPTDVGLMTKVYKKLVEVAKKVRKNGKEFLIRGKNTIRKTINGFNKKRKKAKEEVKYILGTLVEFGERMHGKLTRISQKLTNRQKELLQNAKKIIDQQKEMINKGSKKIKNRIVSFHEQDLRPIFRGKLGNVIEFGKKASIMVVGQALIIPAESEFENYSDTKLPQRDKKRFEKVTGREMKEYTADRGMHSPKNHNLLESAGIKDGIAHRGKIPKNRESLSKYTRRRLNNQRQPCEGKLGTLKTRYGCAKIPYKASNTDVRIGFASMIHNLNWGIRH